MPLERMRWARIGFFTLITAAGCSDTGAPIASDPDAPSGLVAAPLGGGVHLTWNDNSVDEELFEIERKEGFGSFQPLDSVPFSMSSITMPM